MTNTKAEYIWIDGGMPTAKLRSKTKINDERRIVYASLANCVFSRFI